MGTAQQENPVAQFKATSFEVSLTCEEARILAQGLEALRLPDFWFHNAGLNLIRTGCYHQVY
jgi:hypothetical protein